MEEFKKFILRGNVLDLAVAVMIGGAFNKIVTSLVGDIFTPILGLMMGGINFSGLSLNVGSATVKYGAFIQTIIDFLLMASVIFLLLKLSSRMIALANLNLLKQEDKPTKAEKARSQDTPEVTLLKEIRDLLKKKN